MRKRILLAVAAITLLVGLLWSCMNLLPRKSQATGQSPNCTLVSDDFGPNGSAPIRTVVVVTGLEVPWGISFIKDGTFLVTERVGRLRLVENWKLLEEPVVNLPESDTSEGGLLGIVLHPRFSMNRLFYLYRTVPRDEPFNRIERWRLSEDRRSAELDRVLTDKIPAATYHNGGRLRFGPDRMLYASTGDAREPDIAQDPQNLGGKLLRLTAEGKVPSDNPWPGSAAYIMGLRNTQAFDWLDEQTIIIADHGPSGEMLRSGHDEVSLGKRGQNFGWPAIYGCDAHPNMVSPLLVWEEAVPPGGGAIYTGNAIPEWKGDFLIASLESRHLHRVVLDRGGSKTLTKHGVYLREQHGRLREAVMGPDGELYVTTSNCDGRGDCPSYKDVILRVTR